MSSSCVVTDTSFDGCRTVVDDDDVGDDFGFADFWFDFLPSALLLLLLLLFFFALRP